MRKIIIAGNWKMNKTFEEAEDLLCEIAEFLDKQELKKTEVIVCPPAVYLELATDIAEESYFRVGGQNVYEKGSGAYTGEISAPMLSSIDVTYCIVGHSERRKYFQESNVLLAGKMDILLENNITPIFCCGELLAERESGNYFDVVRKQLEKSLFHLSTEEFRNVVIAYEPVWAIGTGVNATPEQAQEMHAFIRLLIKQKYGETIAENTTILYGGSCNSGNASSLFTKKDVDGGLIGGASLIADEFMEIIKQREEN